jgi:hypothetical protein
LVKDHREANVYALLLVALLEKGLPMTLVEVATLEADAKSLCALYQYGQLHGGVRLRRGSFDEHPLTAL